VLDAVENGRETFVVVRKGRAVAHIGPAVEANGKTVKAIMRANPPDRAWLDDLRTLRAGFAVEDRPSSA
jgi:antitoxin (DNA-binding transcriptional repressor) of toxin-antitoxin stability system